MKNDKELKPDMTYTECCLGAQLANSMRNSLIEESDGEETMPDIVYIEAHMNGVWEDIRLRFNEIAGKELDLYDDWEIKMMPKRRQG